MQIEILIVLALLLVLAFDFTNGFHDSSNMIAAAIASRAISPRQSIVIVGCFTFLGPLIAGTAVADTIGSVVRLDDVPRLHSLKVVICGLAAAISWNLITWWKGLPSSSSHALVGGLVGAVAISVGFEHVAWGVSELVHGRLTGVIKVIIALILSPLVGFAFGFVLHRLTLRLLTRATPGINRHLRRGQWFSIAALSFSYGANDAQKSMGIFTLCLLLGGVIDEFSVPVWVMAACAGALTTGILFGGWRIVRTLAFSIYKLRPLHAFNSHLSSGGIIWLASIAGAPVSTTHVVSSSVMGIGASERPRAVHWQTAKRMAIAWVYTMPISGAIAVVLFFALSAIEHGVELVKGVM